MSDHPTPEGQVQVPRPVRGASARDRRCQPRREGCCPRVPGVALSCTGWKSDSTWLHPRRGRALFALGVNSSLPASPLQFCPLNLAFVWVAPRRDYPGVLLQFPSLGPANEFRASGRGELSACFHVVLVTTCRGRSQTQGGLQVPLPERGGGGGLGGGWASARRPGYRQAASLCSWG